MPRSFVLGIDCMFYIMPVANRVVDPDPANNIPRNPAQAAPGGTIPYSSSFNLMCEVREVTLNLTSDTADITTRCSNGWRQMVATLKDASVDFSMKWEPDNANFTEIMNLYDDQCPSAFAILDGPIDANFAIGGPGSSDVRRCGESGKVTGLVADFVVTNFTRNEALEEAVTADVTIQPAVGLMYPEWVEIDDNTP